MEHCHHFSSYLSLPTLLSQNPSTSVTSFSSSIVFGDFSKKPFFTLCSLWQIILLRPILWVFVLPQQLMVKILPVVQPLGNGISSRAYLFSSLRGLIWSQNQTTALVQPNCIDLSGLDVSKGYESCGKRISSEQIHAFFFPSLHHDIKMELYRAMKSLWGIKQLSWYNFIWLSWR